MQLKIAKNHWKPLFLEFKVINVDNCWQTSSAGLLEPRGFGFKLLKPTFNAKNVIRRLSWSISSHFGTICSWNACRGPKWQKNTKTPYFKGSRSFKVIDVDISKKLVASAYYDKQHVCAYPQPFYIRRANNGRITLFKGVPLFLLFTQWHEILSQNTRDFKLYVENQKSLSHLGFDRYRVVTDRHQDERNYHS